MTRWLRAHSVLVGDSKFSSHYLTNTCTPASEDPMPFPGLCRHLYSMPAQTYTHIHIIQNKIFLKGRKTEEWANNMPTSALRLKSGAPDSQVHITRASVQILMPPPSIQRQPLRLLSTKLESLQNIGLPTYPSANQPLSASIWCLAVHCVVRVI